MVAGALMRRQLESATAHVQEVQAGAENSEERARAAQHALQQVIPSPCCPMRESQLEGRAVA